MRPIFKITLIVLLYLTGHGMAEYFHFDMFLIGWIGGIIALVINLEIWKWIPPSKIKKLNNS